MDDLGLDQSRSTLRDPLAGDRSQRSTGRVRLVAKPTASHESAMLVRSGYTVVMSSGMPRSIRFDAQVSKRLTAYVTSHPGWSGSSAANRFVDEALRMEDHPGVVFRDGATGRRAVLIGGPDVREVIRAVKSARGSEPDLAADGIVALVSTNTGVAGRLIDTAIGYWAAYPDEIDAWIDEVESFEGQTMLAWERREGLLAR